jgi:uncharacterized protein YlxP (DUF503 family)
MVIGLLVLEFHIPGVQSLKEKRRVLKSIIERIKGRYNVSVAEVERQDMWQEAVVGIVMVCNEKQVIDRNFSAILRLAESQGDMHVTHISTEIF